MRKQTNDLEEVFISSLLKRYSYNKYDIRGEVTHVLSPSWNEYWVVLICMSPPYEGGHI